MKTKCNYAAVLVDKDGEEWLYEGITTQGDPIWVHADTACPELMSRKDAQKTADWYREVGEVTKVKKRT